MQRWPALGIVAALGWASACAAAAPASTSRQPARKDCATGPTAAGRISGVTPRGELELASGVVVKIAGVRFAGASAAGVADEARAWLEARRERRVELTPLRSGAPDRWGRIWANVGSEEDPDFAGALLSAGLALVDPGEIDGLCRPALLAIEADARGRKAGLWRESGAIPADDAERLKAALGRFAVLEGRVRSVGERRSRTYLDFGRRGEGAATITISKRTWRSMLDRGLTAAKLRGRSVRARGIVEAWRGGPVLELAAADLIEVVDEGDAARR